jgi:hypothetical protein
MKVWITKDALQFGIEETEGEIVGHNGTIAVGDSYYRKDEWQPSKEKALIQVAKMRLAKIRLLEGQIARLKAMKSE